MSGRERALDAALELLAVHGARGLTHRGVDDAAGLPRGSTSNYWRTREALLVGVLDHLLALDLARAAALRAAAAPARVEDLLAALEAFVRWALGPGQSATAARYVVVADPALPPAARARLAAARATLRTELASMLRGVIPPGPDAEGSADAAGVADGDAAAVAATVLAGVDGVLLHALADPDVDPARCVARLVHGLLGPPAPPAVVLPDAADPSGRPDPPESQRMSGHPMA